MVVDTGNGKACLARPEEIYMATDRLQQLFAGVPGILIVDNEYDCLRGEETRELLLSCGAGRSLMPQSTPSDMGHSEKAQIRKDAGLERASWENPPEDFTLRGLAELLEYLPKLPPMDAAARAKVLWEALADLEGRGTGLFYGSYRWSFSRQNKTARFDAAFVRTLNQVAWVPNGDGELLPPGLVLFDTLDWRPSPFLLTKVTFKPPIINQLANEVGIDPAILDLLRSDPAIIAELTSRLSADPRQSPSHCLHPHQGPTSLSMTTCTTMRKICTGDDMPRHFPPGPRIPDGGR